MVTKKIIGCLAEMSWPAITKIQLDLKNTLTSWHYDLQTESPLIYNILCVHDGLIREGSVVAFSLLS